MHPETVVSCLLGRSRLFPRLHPPTPACCGALVPFRLCSRSQPQSSPWDMTSKARASAPSPRPPRRVSRQASQAVECWSAPILCAGIGEVFLSLHCSPSLSAQVSYGGGKQRHLTNVLISYAKGSCKTAGSLLSFVRKALNC